MRTSEDQALQTLHRWLGYEVKSGLLVGLIFFMPYGIVLQGLYLLMFVFTPILIVGLIRLEWYGWLALFVVLMGLAWFGPRVLDLDPRMIQAVYSISAFVPFYFYCWVLKWVVGEKVAEMNAMEAMSRMDAINRGGRGL